MLTLFLWVCRLNSLVSKLPSYEEQFEKKNTSTCSVSCMGGSTLSLGSGSEIHETFSTFTL